MMRRAPMMLLAAGALLAACLAAGADSHTVQPGENLYVIAKHYGVGVDSLARCNGIHDQRLVRPGMVVQLPPADAPAVQDRATKPAVAVEARAEPSPQPRTIVAQSQPKAAARFKYASQHRLAVEPKQVSKPKPVARPTLAPEPVKSESGAARKDPAATAPESVPSEQAAWQHQPATKALAACPEPSRGASPEPKPSLPLALDPEPFRAGSQRKAIGVGTILDLALKLALVLLFAYASVWMLRRLSHRRGRLLPGRGSLRIVETTSLAPNRGLHLVAVGKRVFMIGSTPESINVLGEVSDVTEVTERLEAKPDKASFGAACKRCSSALQRPRRPARSRGAANRRRASAAWWPACATAPSS